VKNTGRTSWSIAALWSEMCLPARHPAMGTATTWYAVTDAVGRVTPEAHDMAIRRIVARGRNRSHGWRWLETAARLGRAQNASEQSRRSCSTMPALSGTVLAWELANEAQHA